jgi:hypothetical protein
VISSQNAASASAAVVSVPSVSWTEPLLLLLMLLPLLLKDAADNDGRLLIFIEL